MNGGVAQLIILQQLCDAAAVTPRPLRLPGNLVIVLRLLRIVGSDLFSEGAREGGQTRYPRGIQRPHGLVDGPAGAALESPGGQPRLGERGHGIGCPCRVMVVNSVHRGVLRRIALSAFESIAPGSGELARLLRFLLAPVALTSHDVAHAQERDHGALGCTEAALQPETTGGITVIDATHRIGYHGVTHEAAGTCAKTGQGRAIAEASLNPVVAKPLSRCLHTRMRAAVWVCMQGYCHLRHHDAVLIEYPQRQLRSSVCRQGPRLESQAHRLAWGEGAVFWPVAVAEQFGGRHWTCAGQQSRADQRMQDRSPAAQLSAR